MDKNITNHIFVQAIELFNATINNSAVNKSDDYSVVPVKDLYEDYRESEKHKLLVYRVMGYILGGLIILSNLSVVVSSGLILRKGQTQKSTYLLLGNVSLADTIVGFSIVYGLLIDYTLNSSAMCIFQTGMLVCPAMVSIFSVGLIAIDRYIYILHGLYYQRWFNTTRVRIGILLIWIISIILSFIPVTGWVNHELAMTRCLYVGLFPGALILLNSILSIIPITVVTILYTFILIRALKTVKTINNTVKIKEITPKGDKPKIRMNRRTVNVSSLSDFSVIDSHNKESKIKRSASFNFGTGFKPELNYRSKSNDDLSDDVRANTAPIILRRDLDKQSKIQFESDYSVCTVDSMTSIGSLTIDNTNSQSNQYSKPVKRTGKTRKIKGPNKWRAIKVVMLTSGSFIFTWIPFFVTVIFFVFCEEKLTNPKCIRLRALLGGPLAILAFINSMLNPLIYAWWHKGFQRSVKAYYKRNLYKYICHIIR